MRTVVLLRAVTTARQFADFPLLALVTRSSPPTKRLQRNVHHFVRRNGRNILFGGNRVLSPWTPLRARCGPLALGVAVQQRRPSRRSAAWSSQAGWTRCLNYWTRPRTRSRQRGISGWEHRLSVTSAADAISGRRFIDRTGQALRGCSAAAGKGDQSSPRRGRALDLVIHGSKVALRLELGRAGA